MIILRLITPASHLKITWEYPDEWMCYRCGAFNVERNCYKCGAPKP